jgi:hypothetical protein
MALSLSRNTGGFQMTFRRLVIAVALAAATLAVPTGAEASEPASLPGLRQAVTSGPAAAAAVEPTMYPPAEKVLYSLDGVQGQRCETGTLCLDVWVASRGTWKVFILRKCVTRALHNFDNAGNEEFINHQTPGTVTRFLGRGGNVIVRSTAPSHTTPIDWGPIWYIDVC